MPALNFNLKVFYSLLKTKSWKPLIVLCNKHQTVSNRKIKKEGWKKIVLGVGQFFFSVSAVNKFVLSPFPELKLRKTFENLILHLRQTVAELGSQVF